MTLKQFAKMLDGREYCCEITPNEEKLAKDLGFVVVFGYSDDNTELRGAIDDEIGCFDGAVLTHRDLQGTILAEWCPEDIDCSWHFSSTQPSEKFCIFEGEELYCVGIVIDNNKPKTRTNADIIRALDDEKLANYLMQFADLDCRIGFCQNLPKCDALLDTEDGIPLSMCEKCLLKWLQQPAEVSE